MRTIFAVLFVFLFLVIGLPLLGLMWIIHFFKPEWADLAQLRIVQWAFRCIYTISGAKIEIIGKENIPTGEAVLYIGNHRSIFDIVITYALCPGLTGYISKKSVKKVPILGIWMKRLHCLFLDRDDIKEGLKVILTAIDKVKSGISIAVFPEGTRNKDQDPASVLPFKEGTFKIASKTGCKIIPMAITGTNELLENHMPWIKKSRIIIKYGTPINPKELSKEDQKKLGAYCHNIIQDMLKEQ